MHPDRCLALMSVRLIRQFVARRNLGIRLRPFEHGPKLNSVRRTVACYLGRQVTDQVPMHAVNDLSVERKYSQWNWETGAIRYRGMYDNGGNLRRNQQDFKRAWDRPCIRPAI